MNSMYFREKLLPQGLGTKALLFSQPTITLKKEKKKVSFYCITIYCIYPDIQVFFHT